MRLSHSLWLRNLSKIYLGPLQGHTLCWLGLGSHLRFHWGRICLQHCMAAEWTQVFTVCEIESLSLLLAVVFCLVGFCFFETELSLHHLGWNAVVQSWLTATCLLGSSNPLISASGLAEITGACQPAWPIFLFFFSRDGVTMLTRLGSNSWPQLVHLPWPPKLLGLQAWVTVPGL